MIGRKCLVMREKNCVKRPRKIVCARTGRFTKNGLRRIWPEPNRWIPEKAKALAALFVSLGICRTAPCNGVEPIWPGVKGNWGRCPRRAENCGATGVGIVALRAVCGTRTRGGDTGGAAMCGEMGGAEKSGVEKRGAKFGAEK